MEKTSACLCLRSNKNNLLIGYNKRENKSISNRILFLNDNF